MKKNILLLIVFFSLHQAISAQEFTIEKLKKDLISYSKQIQKKHANPFNWITRESFLEKVDSVVKISSTLNIDQFIVEFMKINALINDEHTNLDFHFKKFYPLVFYWFEEGITCTAVLSDFKSILGSNLIAINKIPIDSVTGLCRKLVASNTSTLHLKKIAGLLNDPSVLHGLNLTPNADEVVYTFRKELKDTDVVIKAADRSQGGYEYLMSAKQMLRNSNKSNYWMKYDEEKKFLYVHYAQCAEMTTYPFKDFHEAFKQTVAEKKPEKVIIDLRYNGGGNATIFKPLIVSLANLPDLKNKKIYTLIGRQTFSAAVVNAYLLKTTAHSIMLGEESGGKLNHAGSVNSFDLTNSDIKVYYSTRDYYLDATQKGGIIPDVPFKIYLNDFKNGSDPVLDYAIEN